MPGELLSATRLTITLDGRELLRDVSFELRAADMVLLLGRSGTGKSVLLKSLVGFLPLSSGTVRFNGDPVDLARDASALRRSVILVHQEPALLDEFSVLHNVALPLQWRGGCTLAHALVGARDALHALHLEHLAGAHPTSLSSGERKRVALARALVMRPAVLLLDEPVTGLDEQARAEVGGVCGLLQRQGIALLVATHDVEPFQRDATRVMMVHNGQLLFQQDAPQVWDHPAPALRQLLAGLEAGPLRTMPDGADA